MTISILPGPAAVDREHHGRSPRRAVHRPVPTTPTMGPLEAAAYKQDWRASCSYRRLVEKAANDRARELVQEELERQATAATAGKTGRKIAGADREKSNRGFASLRSRKSMENDDEDSDAAPAKSAVDSPSSVGDVAARLMLARAFDARPDLVTSMKTSAPVVVIDVPAADMLEPVGRAFGDVLFADRSRLSSASARAIDRRNYDGVYVVVKEPPKPRDKAVAQIAALTALSLALPFVAVSPHAPTHLADAIIKASTARIELQRFDPVTITRAIRIVTGRRFRGPVDDAVAAVTGLDDLTIAVRFDRTPHECIAELERLASMKLQTKGPRDLALDDLHGMPEAVAWAKSTIIDLADWKKGVVSWTAIDNAVALTGPPGTGKTTFAKVFAAEAGMKFHVGSMAKWQGSGDTHLGHLLRAMREDFDAARATAPSVLLIDECDSFPNRANLTHSHSDYVVTVVNALLEQIDGVAGREGVIVIGASNDLRRCDPAMLRAGRMNRIVYIGLPDPQELAKMMRVRLAPDLPGADLRELSELAVGMTGADIEKVVKDARRFARHSKREIVLADVRRAIAGADDRPEELKYRACVHEASHIVVDVIHNGPDDVFATATSTETRGGISVRTKSPPRAGTYGEYRKTLEIILAGRVGEEMLFGEGGHGAGGDEGSDLERATTIAAAMAGSFGLAGPSPLVYLGAARDARLFVHVDEIRDSVDGELRKAAASCRELLELHRGAVEAVAHRLLRAGRVDGTEVAGVIGEKLEGTSGVKRD